VDRLGPAAHPELAHDVADVELHGGGRDEKLLTDLHVRHAGGEKLQHLEFAAGQLFGGCALPVERTHDRRRAARVEGALTARDRPDGAHQFGGVDVLDDVTTRARVHRPHDELFVEEGG